jgi:hypothetical protein
MRNTISFHMHAVPEGWPSLLKPCCITQSKADTYVRVYIWPQQFAADEHASLVEQDLWLYIQGSLERSRPGDCPVDRAVA